MLAELANIERELKVLNQVIERNHQHTDKCQYQHTVKGTAMVIMRHVSHKIHRGGNKDQRTYRNPCTYLGR